MTRLFSTESAYGVREGAVCSPNTFFSVLYAKLREKGTRYIPAMVPRWLDALYEQHPELMKLLVGTFYPDPLTGSYEILYVVKMEMLAWGGVDPHMERGYELQDSLALVAAQETSALSEAHQHALKQICTTWVRLAFGSASD